jgi:hypothetical protein
MGLFLHRLVDRRHWQQKVVGTAGRATPAGTGVFGVHVPGCGLIEAWKSPGCVTPEMPEPPPAHVCGTV